MVCPLLRGRSPTRSVAPKPLRGLGRASLRLRLGAWVPKNLARRTFLVYWFRRRDAARPDRAAWRARGGPALTPLVTLTRARRPGRGRPAATGSLANAIGRAKTAEGLGRASLRHFGLARGCRGIWRGVISVYWFRGELRFIGFGGAMRLEAIGPAGRCRGGVVSIYWFRRPRVNPSCHPYARARTRPWSARCYGVARQRDRSRQNSRGARACFSPAFRARAWVPSNLARRNFGLLVSRRVKIYWFRRRDAARGDRAAWAVPRRRSFDLLVSAPPR